MRIKEGVRLTGIKPELMVGLMVANDVYNKHGYELVITSCLDGKHSVTSLHYAGMAADLRTRNLPSAMHKEILEDIRMGLTTDYDILLEDTHYHLEWQPRYG